jgi:hypothetical protein
VHILVVFQVAGVPLCSIVQDPHQACAFENMRNMLYN